MIQALGSLTAADYDRLAEEYLASLPLEHFMECVPHARQRMLTWNSMVSLARLRGDIEFFNELLVQYLFRGKVRQVVPDNMLVLATPQPGRTSSNYAVELEVARPFITFEYVSPSATSRRKDYKESLRKYEKELRVPYAVFFDPERQELRIDRHTGTRYELLKPDTRGRCSIPELDLEPGIHEDWVRFWYRGELLDVQEELHERCEQLSDQIERLEGHTTQVLEQLRRRVEQRARKAGRQDILDALPGVSSTDKLLDWLDSL